MTTPASSWAIPPYTVGPGHLAVARRSRHAALAPGPHVAQGPGLDAAAAAGVMAAAAGSVEVVALEVAWQPAATLSWFKRSSPQVEEALWRAVNVKVMGVLR